MITYQQEFLSSSEGKDREKLLNAHWEEVALNKDKIKLNPDYDRYYELEELGILKIFTVRDSGSLVGYFACFVMPHLHYKDHYFATNDVIYISPEHRRGFTALKLIKFAEKCLKEDGVSVIQINTKAHKSFSPLLERMGYKQNDILYGKCLIEDSVNKRKGV